MSRETLKRKRAVELQLPEGLIRADAAFPTVFVETRGLDLDAPGVCAEVNRAVYDALCRVHSGPVGERALIKVHVGEPRCRTRTRPEYVAASVDFLRNRGAGTVVAGDSTVAYTGPRGHKRNSETDCSAYMELAHAHGWSESGPVGVPFVILDRPVTAVPGFGLDRGGETVSVSGVNRFRDFHRAGGFEAAEFVISNPHLTLHTLSGVAGCVKGIAMGCAAYEGKLRMHQSLLPSFDAELCLGCGKCVESCPEQALTLSDRDPTPVVEPDACIGCGECKAVCPAEPCALELTGREITDWERGMNTISGRMTDYAMGLMRGKWAATVHVLHAYDITEKCDCLDVAQTPMIPEAIGFLVGKNPFAMDKLAAELLGQALAEAGVCASALPLGAAAEAAAYAFEEYGILMDTPVETIAPRGREQESTHG